MSLSVIPLTILGQITGVSGSGETALYQVSFKSIDGTPLYGVTAVWTDEQAEIEALAAQKPYGVWINPIDGTFTVKFAGYTYVGSADLTDSDVLAGITPIEFANQSGGGSLPAVTDADNGKVLAVVNGAWDKSDIHSIISEPETLFDGTITITAEDAEIPFDKDVSSYPFEKWTVRVNGLEIPYQAADNAFILESDNIGYRVFDNNGTYGLEVISMTGADYPPVPGDYQVKIVYTSENGEATDIKIVRFYYDGSEPMCDTRIDDIFTDDGIANIRNNIVFMFQNCVGMEVSPADNKSQIRVGFLIEPGTYIRFTLNRNNTVTQQELSTNITLTPGT